MSSAIPPVVAVTPMCPLCNSRIRVRHAKRDGSAFLGCTAYPRCTWTAPHNAVEQSLAKRVLEASREVSEASAVSKGGPVTERDIRALLVKFHPDRHQGGKVDAHEVAVQLTALLERTRRAA